MNRCEDLQLDQDLILRRGSGDLVSAAGELQSPMRIAATRGAGISGGCNMRHERPVKVIPCPRCQSMNTKFCYYNNYSVNQPRHFCRNCKRYWTVGGMLRNVPVGGGSRKKVRSTLRSQRTNDHNHPHEGLQQAADQGHSTLLNMTLQQSNLQLLQLPSTTIQMASTQQQQLNSMLSSQAGATGAAGTRLGSNYFRGNQLLHLQSSGQLIDPPPSNTQLVTSSTPQLSSLFQFTNMDRAQQNGSYNTGSGLTKPAAVGAAPAAAHANNDYNMGLINMSSNLQQDHHASTMPTLHSAMYDQLHESASATAAVKTSSDSLQMGSGVHGGRGFISNSPGFHNPETTMDQRNQHHMEFLSSHVMHKPGYWGA